jgi:Na+/H+ antiporter NhaD/arsenite permease-like protein
MFPVVAVTAVFVITYFFIVTERLHRTTIALAGALAVLLLPGLPLSQEEAVGFVDFNTLGLLTGMMLIVAVLKRTGVFRYLALRVAKAGRGNVFFIFAGFAAITAVASALIDNVTTVLMIVPVIYLISDLLGKKALPFLIMEVVMANVGGMATLIGDPPNILVGSRAMLPAVAGAPGEVAAGGLTFMDFLLNLGPLAVLCFFASLVYLRLSGAAEFFGAPAGEKTKALETMDAGQAVKDPRLLRRSLVTLGVVLAGFLFHHELGLGTATVALAGAAALLVITRMDPGELLAEVEWGVLFFFIGLFVLVGTLEKVGVIDFLANGLIAVADSPALLIVIVLWGAAILSAVLSAVPAVTVLIPLVQILVNHLGASDAGVAAGFWWALAAGACLGGNATVVGAAANMAVVGLSAKAREPLSFAAYARVGVPVSVICLALTTGYVILRYF